MELSCPSKSPVPALEIENLRKSYGAHEVLAGITARAQEGEVLALIGPSGSGKSTLLRCVNLLEQPDSGTISLGGERLELVPDRHGPGLKAASRAQLRRFRSRIGFVFQSFNLWPHFDALGNVAEAPVQVLGLSKKEATARAAALLEKVGLGDRARAYPATLSGGEQQRVAIARALAMNPDVLLFDEPTSALDPERVGEVLGVLRALAAENKTMLIVTHEIRFAREVADRVLFLEGGRIVEEGPPAEVLERPKTERLGRFLERMLAP